MSGFANAISLAMGRATSAAKSRGLPGWLTAGLHHRSTEPPRLRLVQQINFAQRQTLALFEADGERVLVAASPEGGAAFHALRCPSPKLSGVIEVKLEGTVA